MCRTSHCSQRALQPLLKEASRVRPGCSLEQGVWCEQAVQSSEVCPPPSPNRPPPPPPPSFPPTNQAGAFKIGDTAGTLDNIIACKLYRPGSVGFVSKSGGMSNEMYNVLSRATDGLYEGEKGAGGWGPCYGMEGVRALCLS